MTFCKSGYVSSVNASYNYSATPVTFKLNTVYHVDGTTNSDGYTMRATQYWYFKVVGVDIEISYTQANAANLCAGALITGPGEVTTTIDTLSCQTAQELPGMCQTPVDNLQGAPRIVRHSFRICDLLGQTPEQFLGDNTYQYSSASLIGASPDIFCLLSIGAASLGAGAGGSIDYQVKLTQRVVWWSRKANLAN
jgi:hypothetical protein